MGFSDTLALAIIVHQGLLPLKDALINENEDYIRAAAAWSVGQIGRHTPDHAKAVAQADILSKLRDIHSNADASLDLRNKTLRAAKAVIAKCTHLLALQPLLIASDNSANAHSFRKYIIQQFAKCLPNDNAARKSFVQSGALQKIQELRQFYSEQPQSQENAEEDQENAAAAAD